MPHLQPSAIRQTLEHLLAERILVLDGAMGTMVHALKFDEADFRGRRFARHGKDLKNFIDVLALSQPDAIRGQLSASVAQINQTISAVVMNAEAALRMLGAQPADTEAVRRLLACIIKDGMRTGDIVYRTLALMKESTEGNVTS